MSQNTQNQENSKALIGSLASFLRIASKVNAANPDSHTPCGSCDMCCRSVFKKISLSPEEQARFGVEYFDITELGCCPHMGDRGCEVYSERPQACRMFDCRPLAACEIARTEVGGIPPMPTPQFTEMANKWVFKPLTGEDKLAAKAWVSAIHWAFTSLQKKDSDGSDIMGVIGEALKKHPELIKALKNKKVS